MALSTASFGWKIVIWNSFDAPGRDPEHSRCGDRINGPSFPPGDFVSEAVVVAVMGSAQRHRELAPIQVTAWGKITSIEKPDRGANIWSGKANDGERNFLWFYWPRNWMHVQEQDDRNRRCWMNIDPPAGALEEI